MWYLTIIFIIIAAICKAVKDTVEFHYDYSIFSKFNAKYWNPLTSWRNKYKEDLKTPKFWGSTTIFVMFTDAWHLFDFLQTLTMLLAIVLYGTMIYWAVDLIMFYTIFCCIFELFYSIVFKMIRE